LKDYEPEDVAPEMISGSTLRRLVPYPIDQDFHIYRLTLDGNVSRLDVDGDSTPVAEIEGTAGRASPSIRRFWTGQWRRYHRIYLCTMDCGWSICPLAAMKRSDINHLIQSAQRCFHAHGWALPPKPRWDVTDFGLGNWRKFGRILVNRAEESEYCEKLMYAQKGMTIPAHTHAKKKEDIICRWGRLAIRVWSGHPDKVGGRPFSVPIDPDAIHSDSGRVIELSPG